MVRISMPPGTGNRDFAQFPGIEIFGLGFEVVGATALLHAHLHDAIVHAGSLYDLLSFRKAKREWFFDINVLA